jgi:hypothetical protein
VVEAARDHDADAQRLAEARWHEVLDTLDVNGGVIAEQLAALGI